MARFAAQRLPAAPLRTVTIGFLFVAALGHARADSKESVGQQLKSVLLEQKKSARVLVAVREDTGSRSEDSVVVSEALARRLLSTCAAARKKGTAQSGDTRPLSTMTVSSLPRPGELKDLFKKEKADLILMGVWQAGKSGRFVRLELVDDRKVIWKWSGTVGSPAAHNPADPPAGSSKTDEPDSGESKTGRLGQANTGTAWIAKSADNAKPAQSTPAQPGTGGPPSTIKGKGAPRKDPASTPRAANVDPTTLNGKILEFAQEHLGKQVGNGECWTLGADALEYAGAEPPVFDVFGREIGIEAAAAGDILQFENVRILNPDGSWWILGAPGHTAIVGGVNGTKMVIFHQNINGVLRVRQDTIDLANVKSGKVAIYQPVAKTD